MSVNETKDVIFENFYERMGFSKEISYYWTKRLEKKELLMLANKLIEKIPDVSNAKKYYQSFIRKKYTKLVQQSEIITY